MDARLLSVDLRATRSLFIGDLSFFTTEKNLLELFLKFGPLMGVEIKRGRNGESLLYGFVEYESKIVAVEAMLAMNTFLYKGRRMRLNWTNMKAANAPGSESWVPVQIQFSTSNIAKEVTEEFLAPIFIPFGLLADILVKRHIIDEAKTKLSGNAVAYFFDQQTALIVLSSVKDIVIDHVKIRCSTSSSDSKKQRFNIPRNNKSKLQDLQYSTKALDSRLRQFTGDENSLNCSGLCSAVNMPLNNGNIPPNKNAQNLLSTIQLQNQQDNNHHFIEQKANDSNTYQDLISKTRQQNRLSYRQYELRQEVLSEQQWVTSNFASMSPKYTAGDNNNMANFEQTPAIDAQGITLKTLEPFHRKHHNYSVDPSVNINSKIKSNNTNINSWAGQGMTPNNSLQQSQLLQKQQLHQQQLLLLKQQRLSLITANSNADERIIYELYNNGADSNSLNHMFCCDSSSSQSSRSHLSSFSSGSSISRFSSPSSLLSQQANNKCLGRINNSNLNCDLSWFSPTQQSVESLLLTEHLKFSNK